MVYINHYLKIVIRKKIKMAEIEQLKIFAISKGETKKAIP